MPAVLLCYVRFLDMLTTAFAEGAATEDSNKFLIDRPDTEGFSDDVVIESFFCIAPIRPCDCTVSAINVNLSNMDRCTCKDSSNVLATMSDCVPIR
jgi:hypothetical protein